MINKEQSEMVEYKLIHIYMYLFCFPIHIHLSLLIRVSSSEYLVKSLDGYL